MRRDETRKKGEVTDCTPRLKIEENSYPQMATMSTTAFAKLNSFALPSTSGPMRVFTNPVRCAPIYQRVDTGIMCEPCNGRGWLLCDLCKGQKTNVKAENKRIYRRCPSCRAVGYVLCSKCKVFRCVTFPNYDDGGD